jgi:hypothetical protein
MASFVTKTLNSLTRDHIEKAIRSLDAGHSHGFADSTLYDVLFNSKRYPPKAVVGLAAEIAAGTQLGPKDFKGGEESKCFRVLRKAGFEISRKPKVAWILQGNPKDFPVEKHIEKLGFRYWTFDKLHKEAQLGDEVYIYKCGIGAAVIARGIVTELPKPQKDVNHPEIIGTSGTRRELIEGPDTFKIGIEITEQRVGNLNGQISRLEILGNPTLRTCTIMTSKQGSNFRVFENQRLELNKLWASKSPVAHSDSLKPKAALEGNYDPFLWWEDDESVTEAEEGKILIQQHRRRERNPQLAKKKKQQVLRRHGHLACEVCGFVYQQRYGERGKGFIECHHTKPVSTLTEGQKTSLDDLAVVCANCHRMIHASKPWLSIQDLKNLLVG